MNWISVEERLPGKAADVLVKYQYTSGVLRDTEMCVGWRDGDGTWYFQPSGDIIDGEITHWMPLPDPPLAPSSSPQPKESENG